MEKISYASYKNTDEIIELWNICFPENIEFTNWYFKNIYKSENTLIYTKNGIICSMLQELPFSFKYNKATYIYGACTHPNYRRIGLMGELLNRSFKNDIKKGIGISILIPENKELFKFYENFGYMPTSPIKKETIQKVLFNNNSSEYTFKEANILDIENINNLYISFSDSMDFIVRSKLFWKTQIEMFDSLNGHCFCLYNKNNRLEAYGFVWNENTIQIQEMCFTNKKSKLELCGNILNFYNNSKPLEINYYEKNGDKKACIKFHNNTINKNTYIINLLFN